MNDPLRIVKDSRYLRNIDLYWAFSDIDFSVRFVYLILLLQNTKPALIF